MSAMASQINSLTIVYSTVYAGTDQRKHQSSASLAFVRGNSAVAGEFPAQRASNAENVPFDDVIMRQMKVATQDTSKFFIIVPLQDKSTGDQWSHSLKTLAK